MSKHYTDEEFRQWVHLAWAAHACQPRRKPAKMDDLRPMLAQALEWAAPKIAAKALRDTAALLDHTTTRFVNHAGPDPLSDKEFEAAWLRARADEIEAGR